MSSFQPVWAGPARPTSPSRTTFRRLPVSLLFVFSFLTLLCACALAKDKTAATPPHNVIFFIGDGMGPEQVRAARLYNGGALSFEDFPNRGCARTYSANNSVTDSAAAGTALATGVKVNNGVVGMRIPGARQDILNMVEWSKIWGKSTGIVTSSYMTDATPAAFGAHAADRSHYIDIARDFLQQSRPNVLLGGGGNFAEFVDPTLAGYAIVRDRTELKAFTPQTPDFFLSGEFGDAGDGVPYEYKGEKAYEKLPHLSEMTAKALDLLDDDPDGFFLMVEGAKVDKACHGNQIERAVCEAVELSKAVQVAKKWAAGRSDTLIVVTADHETGGLKIVKDNGAGQFPTVTWSTKGHTKTNVNVYAWGEGAEQISKTINNIDFFGIVTGHSLPAGTVAPPAVNNIPDPRIGKAKK
ncbi:MAG TPA: alkaline phosphatase [Candidatus Sumerlaeota bacterium]|nr:alkaline phosphatase [Candidatus Sumerlaeota bacterium]